MKNNTISANSFAIQIPDSIPTLDKVLYELGPLPEEALFLGMCSDGGPELLNLRNPSVGPVLVIADERSGKTALLSMIARATDRIHKPENVTYCAVHPELEAADQLIYASSMWTEQNQGNQIMVFMLDCLDQFSHTRRDYDIRRHLQSLFIHGPAKKVWPIVTINSIMAAAYPAMIEPFETRIYGHIENLRTAGNVGARGADTHTLHKGTEFTVRERDHWNRFWVPG